MQLKRYNIILDNDNRHRALWEQVEKPQLMLQKIVTKCKLDGPMSLVLDVTNFNTVGVEEILITLQPREIALKGASVTFQH